MERGKALDIRGFDPMGVRGSSLLGKYRNIDNGEDLNLVYLMHCFHTHCKT